MSIIQQTTTVRNYEVSLDTMKQLIANDLGVPADELLSPMLRVTLVSVIRWTATLPLEVSLASVLPTLPRLVTPAPPYAPPYGTLRASVGNMSVS